jgi:hypothetical protein
MPMHRRYFLIVTALAEGGTGLLLVVWPPLPLALLLGVEQSSPEALFAARIAAAALLAIGVACWLERGDKPGPAPPGLIAGVLVYDVGAAVVLAYTGLFAGLVGVALWPAAVLHVALAVWCAACLRAKARGGERD